MKTLIFEPAVSGHHLEYLHHYYIGALQRPQEEFVFVVTRKFEDVKDKYEWKEVDNITICFIDAKYDSKFSTKNPYVLGWNTSRVLMHYVKEHNPDKVLLTMLMQFIPFICFLLPRKVRVKGIMYKIYLYEIEKMSRLRLLAERLRFFVASKSKAIESIFVLNDEDSAAEFNRIYKTDKFKFIPDPVPEVDLEKCKDLREELSIPKDNKIFLHFGGLDKRKGTLEILKAIELSEESELTDKTFIFAGRIKGSLRDEFYALLEQIKQKAQIIVFDEFCSYELLYNLCYTCDVILMPYELNNLSSGVLGYATVFGKPIIGPSQGLMGKLMCKYNLGCELNQVNSHNIREALLSDINIAKNNYSKTNKLHIFINIIMGK